MGKSKKRILHKGINDLITNITREDALKKVVKAFNTKKMENSIRDLISLFGFTAEELLEAGAQYEDVICINSLKI